MKVKTYSLIKEQQFKAKKNIYKILISNAKKTKA